MTLATSLVLSSAVTPPQRIGYAIFATLILGIGMLATGVYAAIVW